MCGRYALISPPDVVRRAFGYAETPNFPPRANIAPTQPVALAAQGPGGRRFHLARWGFLPGFVKDPKGFPTLINARAEGLADKASFRGAARRRRCLFLADGWYEWRRTPGPGRAVFRQPFLFRRRDGAPFGIAGLYETWSDPFGGEMDTAALITVPAGALGAAIHPRAPAVIAPEDFDQWLDCADDKKVHPALALLRPAEAAQFVAFEVGPRVNNATHEGLDLQDPVDETSAWR